MSEWKKIQRQTKILEVERRFTIKQKAAQSKQRFSNFTAAPYCIPSLHTVQSP